MTSWTHPCFDVISVRCHNKHFNLNIRFVFTYNLPTSKHLRVSRKEAAPWTCQMPSSSTSASPRRPFAGTRHYSFTLWILQLWTAIVSTKRLPRTNNRSPWPRILLGRSFGQSWPTMGKKEKCHVCHFFWGANTAGSREKALGVFSCANHRCLPLRSPPKCHIGENTVYTAWHRRRTIPLSNAILWFATLHDCRLPVLHTLEWSEPVYW